MTSTEQEQEKSQAPYARLCIDFKSRDELNQWFEKVQNRGLAPKETRIYDVDKNDLIQGEFSSTHIVRGQNDQPTVMGMAASN